MKKKLLVLFCIFLFGAKSQNGFTTYTTNLTISGVIKIQKAFLVDNNGNKWIGFLTIGGNGNAGLVKYNNSTWTLYNQASNPAFPSNLVTSLAKDNSGNIWIGTKDVGLVKFDGINFTTYNVANGLPSNVINSLETIGNQIYIATDFGLSRFDGVAFTNYNVANGSLPSDTITCIKSENVNKIWLGGLNSLVEFNVNGTSTSFINHLIPQTEFQPGIFYNTGNINCIYIDSQNNKWLGSTTAGLVKYSGVNFQNASTLYEVFGSYIPAMISDIALGFHNGIIFAHPRSVVGTTPNPNSFSGLIELTQNKVYQYFYPSSYNINPYVENDNAKILISGGTYNSSNMYYSFDTLNYKVPLGSINVNNFKSLDINNVKAGISNRGDMHFDIGGNMNSLYEVPKGSNKHSSYASALWIVGSDNSNFWHGGAQTYRQIGNDFWPGPLDTISGSIDSATSVKYDKIWKVSYTDINTFITAFNSGSVIATPDMLTWPAHGTGNNSRNLAPFVDRNGDGLYNPNDGDYPKIKGDQTLYYVFNDKLASHSTSSQAMGIEVHAMAYAYGCSNVINGHNELTYTTFYNYKIINRSSNNYHDVWLSLFSDADIGNYSDDFIGCNVADNYGYGYNASNTDSYYGNFIPAQGYHILKGPIANLSDGLDNDNNGVIDEFGEECKLNFYRYYNPSFGTNTAITEPVYFSDYAYVYMQGRWRDNTPFTCGGNGYGGTINTNYAYPGDPNNLGVSTDPNNICGYWLDNSLPGDRRTVMTSGPFTLNSGQMQEVEYAFVTSFDSSSANNSNLLSVAKLKSDIQKVNTFYNLSNKPNCLQSITVGITEVPKQNDFVLFPNPSKSLITISSTINGTVKVNYEIVDVLGKVVVQNENTSADKFSININDLNSGIYFLRLHVNNSVVVKKFVKE